MVNSKEDLAMEFESKGQWRDAFREWNELITYYSEYVSEDKIAYWIRHRDMCADNF